MRSAWAAAAQHFIARVDIGTSPVWRSQGGEWGRTPGRVMQGLCWRDGFALNWWQHVTMTLPWKNAWWKPLGFTNTLVPQKLRYSNGYIAGIESNKRRVYRHFSHWNGHEVFGESLMVYSPHGLMSKFMASVQTQFFFHPTWGSCASSPSSSYGKRGISVFHAKRKPIRLKKKLGWSTCPLPFFLHRRGQMNGLLHLWRFSSLKRAHKRLWERTFGPACPWKGTTWHRNLAKVCPPVIKHVWEILVKNWEHHLNCIKSLGCHFLVPDYPLELDYFHCHVTMFISQSRRYWIASSSFQVCLTGMPRTAWTRVGFHQDHQALKPGKNMSDQLSHPKFTCFIMFFTVSVHVISVIYPNKHTCSCDLLRLGTPYGMLWTAFFKIYRAWISTNMNQEQSNNEVTCCFVSKWTCCCRLPIFTVKWIWTTISSCKWFLSPLKCSKIMILPSTLTNSYQFCDIRDLVGEPLVQSCFQIILVTLLRSPISVLWDELI